MVPGGAIFRVKCSPMPQCHRQWYCGESSCNALRCDVDPRKLIVRATRKPQGTKIWDLILVGSVEEWKCHFSLCCIRLCTASILFQSYVHVFMRWFTLDSGPRRLSGGQKGCLSRLLGPMQGYQIGPVGLLRLKKLIALWFAETLGSIKMHLFHK